jgi:hypothetical protein
MRCRVNGRDVDAQALARREMNFGQTFPGSELPLQYEIIVPTADFITALRDVYLRYAKDEMADAPYHEVGEWPLLDRLQDLGYPPLEQLVASEPALLADLVREWLTLETLDLLIPGSATGLPEYLVNTIDQVVVDQQSVRILGQAYRHPALVNQS